LFLAETATAQSVTINGRPFVPNPRQQINSLQSARVFGGLNIAAHAIPPAGQPAFLSGNPIVVQQKNAAQQANGNYGSLSPNLPASTNPWQVIIRTEGGFDDSRPFAMQGWIAAGSAPNVPLRPLTSAEFNRLFGDLQNTVNSMSSYSAPR
jgi:hypothetical protein